MIICVLANERLVLALSGQSQFKMAAFEALQDYDCNRYVTRGHQAP